MMARITLYKNSILASIISILGYICCMFGIVMMIQEKEFVAGILLILIGFGFICWAAQISENKRFKQWKKKISTPDVIAAIQNDIAFAVKVYNAYPSKKTLAYIRSLNPGAADRISQLLASQKNK